MYCHRAIKGFSFHPRSLTKIFHRNDEHLRHRLPLLIPLAHINWINNGGIYS